MATFVWTAQTTAAGDEVIGATDVLSFYGTNFNDAVDVGEYQDSSHVEDNANVEQCTVTHISNCKFLTSTTVSIDGAASETLGAAVRPEADCTLEIHFNESPAVACSSVSFWAYDGATESAVPTAVTFQCGEQGDTVWSNAEGSGAAMSMEDSGSATDHYFYLFMSVSPESVGVKTAFELKIQLTYQ